MILDSFEWAPPFVPSLAAAAPRALAANCPKGQTTEYHHRHHKRCRSQRRPAVRCPTTRSTRFPAEVIGGTIGLVTDGDEILIDVGGRRLTLLVDDAVLAQRRAKMDAAERPWSQANRERPLTTARRAYASMATSADTGAVREIRYTVDRRPHVAAANKAFGEAKYSKKGKGICRPPR